MIFITDEMYAEIACKLLSELKNGEHFFNGKIEYDTTEFYSTLTCSLVIYRKTLTPVDIPPPEIEKIIPVWWDFNLCAGNVPQVHDFSWSELASFLPRYA